MKSISEQATNKINIIGKLLDTTFNKGTTKAGAPYERATATVRVTQTYGGQEETSEVPLSLFATQFTNKGAANPAFKSIQDLKELKTVQNVGFDEADTVRFSGATISENNFVSKSGQLINGWQIRASFINKASATDIASFNLDIFIMDIHPEEDRDGEPTGRLIVKGGLVQYGGKLDVLEFIVEGPDKVEYVERNQNIHDTVNVRGRIRVTSIEEKPHASSSWGEDVPDETTRMVRELIITTGDDTPKEEDFAYDPTEIKKAFNVRKAEIEQLQLDAKNGTTKTSAASGNTPAKYSWE